MTKVKICPSSLAVSICMVITPNLYGQVPNTIAPASVALPAYATPIPLSADSQTKAPLTIPQNNSRTSSDDRRLELQMILVELDRAKMRSLGIDFNQGINLEVLSSPNGNESFPVVGKGEINHLQKLIESLVQNKLATVISKPRIIVVSGAAAYVSIGANLKRVTHDEIKEDTPIDFNFTFLPTLVGNHVQMDTKIEQIQEIKSDRERMPKNSTRSVAMSYPFDLGDYYIIEVGKWNQIGTQMHKEHFLILSIDRAERPEPNVGFIASQNQTQHAAARLADEDAFKKSRDPEMQQFKPETQLPLGKQQSNENTAKKSLSNLQQEMRLLRNDVARIKELLELRR